MAARATVTTTTVPTTIAAVGAAIATGVATGFATGAEVAQGAGEFGIEAVLERHRDGAARGRSG